MKRFIKLVLVYTITIGGLFYMATSQANRTIIFKFDKQHSYDTTVLVNIRLNGLPEVMEKFGSFCRSSNIHIAQETRTAELVMKVPYLYLSDIPSNDVEGIKASLQQQGRVVLVSVVDNSTGIRQSKTFPVTFDESGSVVLPELLDFTLSSR